MATRSYIAMKIGENAYKGVYCHYDGYLDYNGLMLYEHYNTTAQRSICRRPTSTCAIPSFTVFYGRDRGEEGQEAFTCTEEELKDTDSWIEYIYVFDNGKWYYSVITRIGFTDFMPLEPAIIKIRERRNLQ